MLRVYHTQIFYSSIFYSSHINEIKMVILGRMNGKSLWVA
jgi:hypothetical protein